MIHTPNSPTGSGLSLLSLCVAAFALTSASYAASDTWDGDTDLLWSDSTNWVAAGAVPGTGETATFNSAAGVGGTVINLGGGITISAITFDTASVAAYTIGAGVVGTDTLTLDNGGSFSVSATVLADQIFNSDILLGNDATASTYTLTNESATNSLSIAGGITGATGGTADAKTLAVTGAGATILSGDISNGGSTSLSVTKSGAGPLTLSGSNTYTGDTTLSAGILNLNSATALGDGTSTFINAGGVIDNISGSAITLANNNPINLNATLSFEGTNNLNLGTGTVTLSADRALQVRNGAELTIGGDIAGGSLRLDFSSNDGSSGVTVLSGNNSYGITDINNRAVLRIASSDSIGSGQINLTSNGAVLELGDVSISNNLSMSNTNQAGGAKRIRMASGATAATFAGDINKLENTAGEFVITAASGQTLTISGSIYESQNRGSRVTLNGAGLVVLSGDNTHNNETRLTGTNANVRLAHDGAAGGSVVLAQTGTMAELADGITIAEPLSITGTGAQKTLALQTGAATGVWAGNIINNEGGIGNFRVSADGSGELTLSGVISGAGSLRKDGTGTVIVSGATNTYTGHTIITNGTLKLGAANAIPSSSSNFSSTADTGLTAVLDLNGFDQSLNSFASSGLGSNVVDNTALGTVTLTIGNNDGSGDYEGIIQNTGGALAVDKVGAGSITLSGANTYTGTTTVSSGELVVSGSVTSDVSVSASATLSGEGTLGDLTLASGSNIEIIPTGGDEFTVDVLLASGANVVLDGAASGSDIVVVNYTTYDDTNFATDFIAPTSGTLTHDASNKRILLSIRSAEARTWDGSDVSNPTFWDSVSENWAEGDLLFINGDSVTFSDTAVGTVSVQGPVAPGSITFTNTSGNDYTIDDLTANVETISAPTINITGDGDVDLNVKITGNTDITHSGSGTLTLGGGAVNNDFVGTITVDGGGTLRNARYTSAINSLGAFTNTFIFSNGSTFDVIASPSGTTDNGYKSYGTGSFVFNHGTTLTNSSNGTNRNVFLDELVFNGDVTIDGAGRLDIDGDIAVTGTDIVITFNNDTGCVLQTSNAGKSIAEFIINDGIVFASNNASFGDAVITVNTGGAFAGNQGAGRTIIANAVTLNGGAIQANSNNSFTQVTGTITVTADSIINPVTGSRDVELNGVLTESGAGGNLSLGIGQTFMLADFDATGFTGDFILDVDNADMLVLAGADFSGYSGDIILNSSNADLSVDDGVDFPANIIVADTGDNKIIRLQNSAGAGFTGTYSGNITINETGNNDFDINSGDATDVLTVSGAISGTGAAGIQKTGLGTVILSGTNTYSGNTTNNSGTLTLANGGRLTFFPTLDATNNRINGSATVNLDGEMFLDLSGADTTLGLERSWELVTVNTLTVTFDTNFSVNSSLGAFTEDTGVWTLSDSGNTWTFTESTGILTLQTPYAAWADGFTFSGTGAPELDDDTDGLVSILEYAFGTNPTVSDASALFVSGGSFTPGTPIVEVAYSPSLDVKARFVRRTDHLTAGITYTVQFSNDLSTWAAADDIDGGTAVIIPGTSASGDYEAVEIDYPLFLDDGKKAKFFRLSINDVNAPSVSP